MVLTDGFFLPIRAAVAVISLSARKSEPQDIASTQTGYSKPRLEIPVCKYYNET
ncbi:MAG: hypothetical protein LBB48_07025 [Treponema sp.]|nr:hypothetical protein [Treponema sp.]